MINIPTIPDSEMLELAKTSLNYANGYYTAFTKSINNQNSRFDSDLLYQMALMSAEKYFIALLARYDWNATHHMPIAMFKEALQFEPELTDSMKQTCILVGKFEAICSIEGFGYRQPSKDDLAAMDKGINEIRALVEKRIEEVYMPSFE